MRIVEGTTKQEHPFLNKKVTVENNDSHSILVKYTLENPQE